MFSVALENMDAVVADLAGVPAGINRAAVRAMNRAMTGGRAEVASQVGKDVGLRVGVVKDALPIRKASVGRLEAAFGTGLKRIPLVDFGATGPEPSRGRGRGVSYKLGAKRGRIPNAFLATMASGHRGVFRRKAVARLKILELYGPSLGHVLAKYRPAGLARVRDAFETNFTHELSRLKEGAGDAGTD